jgi:hypothetical protein
VKLGCFLERAIDDLPRIDIFSSFSQLSQILAPIVRIAITKEMTDLYQISQITHNYDFLPWGIISIHIVDVRDLSATFLLEMSVEMAFTRKIQTLCHITSLAFFQDHRNQGLIFQFDRHSAHLCLRDAIDVFTHCARLNFTRHILQIFTEPLWAERLLRIILPDRERIVSHQFPFLI